MIVEERRQAGKQASHHTVERSNERRENLAILRRIFPRFPAIKTSLVVVPFCKPATVLS